MFIDAVVTAGLGRGFEVVTWPIVQRVSTNREWTADLWIATLRYERAGRIGVRIDRTSFIADLPSQDSRRPRE